MNEIVRKVVRVADLPEDLQAGFDPAASVEIKGPSPEEKKRSIFEVLEEADRLRKAGVIKQRFKDGQDIVAYVHALRDGEDLDRWLGPCSTSTPTS
jgi:hypothetical protein